MNGLKQRLAQQHNTDESDIFYFSSELIREIRIDKNMDIQL